MPAGTHLSSPAHPPPQVDGGALPLVQETPVHDTPIPLARLVALRRLPVMKRVDAASLIAMIVWVAAFAPVTCHAAPGERTAGRRDWALMAVLHGPFLAILSFLLFGFIERFGYFRVAHQLPRPDKLPIRTPKFTCDYRSFTRTP